jgi:hypothetical protein
VRRFPEKWLSKRSLLQLGRLRKATSALRGSIRPRPTGGMAPLAIKLVNAVDWQRYELALVSLRYDDAEHNVHHLKEVALRPNEVGVDPEWILLVQDPVKNVFQYRIRLVGINEADNRDEGWVETTETVVIVE